ncbi:MAG: thioredoxin family protein [Candidatus Delongbacteria bacterium]|nr:thioredoxin family protein [Candidatus Delongbacteria bacterium]
MLDLTPETYWKFITSNADMLLLLDFWSDHCPACGLMKYTLQRTKPFWETHIMLAGINTRFYPQLAEINEVTALPTLLIFYNHRCIHRIVGAVKPDAFMNAIRNILNDIREDKNEAFSQY